VKTKTDSLTIKQWLTHAREQLADRQDEPALSAQLLIAHHLHKDRAWVIAHSGDSLAKNDITALETGLIRLTQGVPLPYVLGKWEFYGLPFTVNEHVLIPRPETELLVEQALTWIAKQTGSLLAVDVGTGSGCIAASLARHAPRVRVIAIDVSLSALRVARVNFSQLAVNQQVSPAQSSLLSAVSGPFNLICANLPYIPSSKLHQLSVAAFEPSLALDGGLDGLALIQELLLQARTRIALKALILLEIEADHGQTAPDLAQQIFPHAAVNLFHDLAGLPRLVRILIE
jgi:release factor glutamine methyltransferase